MIAEYGYSDVILVDEKLLLDAFKLKSGLERSFIRSRLLF